MIVQYPRGPLAVLSVVLLLSSAVAVAPECQCTTITAVVCGEDGNSYQNLCLAECQGIPVVAMGPCTAESARGTKMAEAFHSATLEDPSLAAAMSAHDLAPLTPQQLDQVAAGAASVVQGFERLLPARLVTAADMARLEKQGYVLVGALKPAGGFDPTPPPVPEDAAERPPPQLENFGATEAVATADGFLYKPKLLAKHAATVAVAAAKAAVEAAAAQQENSPAGTVTAKTVGLVSLQPFLPKDMTAEASGPDDVSDEAGAGPATGPGPDPIPTDPEHDSGSAEALAVASARLRIGGRRRLQTVFSPDERLDMTNRQKTLVRAVGRVTFDFNNQDHFCSGALIGQYTVLTAAHCVLSVDQPGLTASDWTFAPAINKWGLDPRYGRSRAAMFFFDTRFWDKDSWWLWDMAVVVLEQPLGRKTGYFGVGYMPDGYKGSLTTAGYPGDKPLWSFWWIPGGNQCVVRDRDGSDTVMTHKCDTYPGQSGSPMWFPDTSTIMGVVGEA